MKTQIQYKKSIAMISLASSAVLLTACSGFSSSIKLPEHKIDYKNSKSVKSLEVPPDLSRPEFDSTYAVNNDGTVSAAAYNRQGGQRQVATSNVLKTVQGLQIKRAGNVSWLEAQAPAEVLWPKLTAFWSQLGIALKNNEPQVGLMETEWVENQAGLPMDWIRKALGSVLQGTYDAGSRDKFKLRIERPSANTTHIFISHRGAEEVLASDGTGVKWEKRPADGNLEAEILNRLSAFLQGNQQAATQSATIKPNANRVTWSTVQGRSALRVADSRKRTWLRVGVMLERAGLAVEGQDQATGVYKVIYGNDPQKEKKGWFSKVTGVFSTNKNKLTVGNEYQIHLSSSGTDTLIMATGNEGKPLSKQATQSILTRLKAEFDR